jgi:hypothetical protein
MKLAEANRLLLQLNGWKVTSVAADWRYYVGNHIAPLPNDDDVVQPITYDQDGRAYISPVPMRLGRMQLILRFSFEDRRIEQDKIGVEVGLPDRKPAELIITSGWDYKTNYPTVELDVSEAHRKGNLDPAAVYSDVARPVPLAARDVRFKVIAISDGGSPVDLDSTTGAITALHIGQALVETSFDGISTLTCIDVMQDVRGGSRSHCEKLLPPGRTLPPGPMEKDPRPPPLVTVHSRQ